ncbi:hypothetical protein [Actinophytocola sediminis]
MIVIQGGGVAEYRIFLVGCHDVTMLHVELSPTEAALISQLSRMSREASENDCQPRLSIVKRDHPELDPELDKVVSIDEQNPVTSPFGDRARLGLVGDVVTDPPRRARGFGGGGGVRAVAMGDAVSGVAGEDRPR